MLGMWVAWPFVRTRLPLSLCLLLIGCFPPLLATPPLRVAAASDLSEAFELLGREFAKREAGPVFSYGSSGLLAKQIMEGAPFDVFAAANASYVDQVLKAGVGDPSSKSFLARGRLVVWVPIGEETPRKLSDLTSTHYKKIALANPEHAPFGQAAVQALLSSGVYERVKSKLVFGENVRQALQFARSGNADAAIVSVSHTIGIPGTTYEIPPTLFQPIDLTIVICSKRPEAKRFVQFVRSHLGRTILRQSGYLFPEEAVTP